MEYINCRVDTQPMADELHSVSRHVTGTTTAVVAMQAAVIQADKEAAERVCNDVNRGFHALMSSTLSQKIANLQSEVDSYLMRLNQQTKQLLNIKRQMERDYMRTAQRYTKTFNSLNKELRQRVQELDQPIFRFATTEVETTHNRMTSLTATVPIGQTESVTDAQRILTSNVKYHGIQVLEAAKSFVASMEDQKALTNRILLANQKAESKVLYMPVVISERCFEQGSSSLITSCDALLSPQNTSSVRGELMQVASTMPWHESAADEKVTNELVRLMAESDAPERIKRTIQKLMEKAPQYQTL